MPDAGKLLCWTSVVEAGAGTRELFRMPGRKSNANRIKITMPVQASLGAVWPSPSASESDVWMLQRVALHVGLAMAQVSSRCGAELRLRDGGGFDYLYLFHHPASATACIQVLYTPEGVKLPEHSMVR